MTGKRLETLDALRGVAALAVVTYHLKLFHLGVALFADGYLAVDFFFVLSGLVLASGYSDRLASGGYFGAFLRARVIRLYPLAFVSALGAVIVLIAQWKIHGGDSLSNILIGGALNLALIPNPLPDSHGLLFHGDNPLWSLFFEFAINIVWALVAVRLATKVLIGVVIISGLALVAFAIQAGTFSLGVGFAIILGGCARVTFGFSMGVLIYRLRDVELPTLGPAVLGTALLVAFVGNGMIWDGVCVFLVMPLVVKLGSGPQVAGHIGRFLGTISYPIYALHWPMLAVLAAIYKIKLNFIPVGIFEVGAVALIVGVSYAAAKLYDEPVRKFLARRSSRLVLAREP